MHNLLIGAAAGALATIPMTVTMEALHARLPGEPPRPLPPREIAEAVAVKTGTRRTLDETTMQNVTLAGHVAYGALTGAAFAAIAPRTVARAVGAGVAMGYAVWAGSYMGWLPAAGIRQPVRYDPPDRTRLMIAAHLVWGACAGLIVGTLAHARDGRVSTQIANAR